jgi:glucose-6-phosphate isomerase, archaeal
MSTAAPGKAARFDELMTPWSVGIDLIEGVMDAPDRVLTRRASDMRGYYKDAAALDAIIQAGDPVHYEVFEKVIPEEYGHLLLCISKLYPGDVGGECFMTKGHYHTVAGTGEVYLCVKGDGYMVMKTTDGRTNEQKMVRNRMVYVPPFWAHRSVNTGGVPLISFCVYPADAGHNYGDIEKEGFPQIITRRDGRVAIEKK